MMTIMMTVNDDDHGDDDETECLNYACDSCHTYSTNNIDDCRTAESLYCFKKLLNSHEIDKAGASTMVSPMSTLAQAGALRQRLHNNAAIWFRTPASLTWRVSQARG